MSGDVESDHLGHLLDIGIQQGRDGSGAGIVDEHRDDRIIPERLFPVRDVRLIVEIGRQGSDRASGLPRQAAGDRLEPCLVSAHQDEVIAALCETIGIDSADAPGGAGHDGSTLRGVTHGLLLSRRSRRTRYRTFR